MRSSGLRDADTVGMTLFESVCEGDLSVIVPLLESVQDREGSKLFVAGDRDLVGDGVVVVVKVELCGCRVGLWVADKPCVTDRYLVLVTLCKVSVVDFERRTAVGDDDFVGDEVRLRTLSDAAAESLGDGRGSDLLDDMDAPAPV